MNLKARVERLEDNMAERQALEWDLSALTDAELINLEACFSRAKAIGEPVHQLITPELYAALERVKLNG